MRVLLSSLINIAQRTGRFTVAQATAIYNGLWMVVGFTLIACVAAFLMNAGLGWKIPSLVLAIVFAIAAAYMWAKPLNILAVAGAGGVWGLANRIAGDATIVGEIEGALRAYISFLKWVLLAGVTFLFITGTLSFRENPGAVLPLIVALGVIGLLAWMWPKMFAGVLGRKLLYWYAMIIIVVSLGSLIPGSMWKKHIGWDPATTKTTSTEDGLYRLDRTRREMADTDRAKELERITDKIRRREALTQAEEHFIAGSRRQSEPSPRAIASPEARTRQWTKLVLTANGRSSDLPFPISTHPVIDGDNIIVHYKYHDGRECASTKRDECPDGDIPFIFLSNESSRENTFSYTFVR